ncbi:MAG: recombination regulator RecX [Thiotrichales bacterium]|nr:recombination regulator RecX [Thiotrichales bacterium]
MQNDNRFAEDFVQHRINKGQGPNKIRQELRRRGVDDTRIDAAFAAVPVDWRTLAETVRSKKFGEVPPADLQNKAKQSRFLYSRGFDSELINQC